MDISNNIHLTPSLPGKLTKVPEPSDRPLPATVATPSKTVPFFPRVLFSVQQPLSSIVNQTGVIPTSSSTSLPVTSQNILPNSHLAAVTSINNTGQFIPLIFAAASAVPQTTVSSTPLQIQLNSYSGVSSVASSQSSNIVLQSNMASGSPISMSTYPITSHRLNPASNIHVSNSTSVPTTYIGRTLATSCQALAPVVFSPQQPSPVHSTLALRFTRAPNQCGTTVVTPLTSSSCPLVLEANYTQPLTQNVTTVTFSTSASGSLLMSSAVTSTSRVLIHKPNHISQTNSSTGSVSTTNLSGILTTISSPPKTNSSSEYYCGNTLNTSNPTLIVHDQLGTQAIQTASKAKLVSFTAPGTANMRFITTSSPVSCIQKTLTTSGILTMSQSVNTNCVLSGINVTYTNLSPTSSSSSPQVVTIPPSQSLLLQTHTDGQVHTTSASNTPTLNPNLITSLRNLTNPIPTISTALPLTGWNNPTVLAFNLTGSTLPSATVSTATPPPAIITNPVRQISPGSTGAAPLIIRANNGPSAVTFVATATTTSILTPMTSTSLLKPFNLNISSGVSASPSFLSSCVTCSVTSVPHILPVNIAPAKLTPLQPSGSISTAPISRRQNISQGNSSSVNTRQPTSSVFPQQSRKRSRKQQLASTFSSAVGSASSMVPSTAPVAVNLNSIANPVTTSGSNCSRNTNISHGATLLAIPKPSNQQQQQMAQPVHNTQLSHIQSVPGSTLRTTNIAYESINKPGSTILPVGALTPITCTNSLLNSPTNGFMGIRLLSVRTTPATTSISTAISCQPTTTTVFVSSSPSVTVGLGGRVSVATHMDATSLMIVSPTSSITAGSSHLRLASPHPSQCSDPQGATVYVLTTSAYPVLSNTTTPVISTTANSSGVELMSTNNSTTGSYTTTVMVPGSTTSVVQVRFRSHSDSISTNCNVVCSVGSTENTQSSTQCSVPSLDTENLLQADSIVSDVQKPANDDTSHQQNSTTKQICCPSLSNPLLHHLVSSQQPSHLELLCESHSTQNDCDTNNYNTVLETDAPYFDYEMSITESWLNDLGKHLDGKSPPTNCLNKHKNIDHRYQGDDLNDTGDNDVEIDESDESANESCFRHVSRKKFKTEQELISPQHSKDNASDKKLNTGLLWTVDPNDGREWILYGRPPRSLIIPHYGMSSTRAGTPCRSKATHFLSSSEVRLKLQPSTQDSQDSSNFHISGRRRRGRRGRRFGSSVGGDQSKSENDHLNGSSDECGLEKQRLVQDVLTLRAEQDESDFVRYPLTITSMLNLTGWRALRCANNLDLLAYTELQALQSVDNLHTDVCEQLHQLSDQAIVTDSCVQPIVSHSSFTTSRSTMLSLSPIKASQYDCDLSDDFRKAIDLIEGISQRKRYLLDSIQRLNLLTKNLVEHFSPEIHQFIEELEDNTDFYDPSTVNKPTLLDVSLAASIASRRSARKNSLSHPTLRKIRGRPTTSAMANDVKSNTVPLAKGTPSNSPLPSTSPAVLCNGNIEYQTNR